MITLRPAGDDWRDAVEMLRRAVDAQGMAAIEDQWRRGVGALYVAECSGIVVLAVALRIDAHPAGDEGVILAAAGELPGFDLVGALLPSIERLFTGCKRVRFHTGVPAVARKMAQHGYRLRELVCEKET